MSGSKQARRSATGETSPQSNRLELIKNWLKVMSQTWPQKELFPDEIERWMADLSAFPPGAINWAFDNWRRNGDFFPVPSVILDQCVAWEPDEKKYTAGCSKECKARHGKGYHTNDMLKLWKMYDVKRAEINGPLKDDEIEALLVQIDKQRGTPPVWRRA
jgi:hypothetical protein